MAEHGLTHRPQQRCGWLPAMVLLLVACAAANETSPPPTSAAHATADAPPESNDGFSEIEPGIHWRSDRIEHPAGRTATHALLVAAAEPRIRAVAAFAPVVDLATHFGRAGFDEPPSVSQFSPISHLDRIQQPTLLFAATREFPSKSFRAF